MFQWVCRGRTNEHDGRHVLARDLEQVADARRRDALEHLHELGAVGRVEGHARLIGHGLGQVRLARAGRALHEETLPAARPPRVTSQAGPARCIWSGQALSEWLQHHAAQQAAATA